MYFALIFILCLNVCMYRCFQILDLICQILIFWYFHLCVCVCGFFLPETHASPKNIYGKYFFKSFFLNDDDLF